MKNATSPNAEIAAPVLRQFHQVIEHGAVNAGFDAGLDDDVGGGLRLLVIFVLVNEPDRVIRPGLHPFVDIGAEAQTAARKGGRGRPPGMRYCLGK